MNVKDIITVIDEIKDSKKSVEETLATIGSVTDLIEQSAEEVILCIELFNADSFDENVYINAAHTKSLIGNNLPSISDTLDLFMQAENRKKVMNHLVTSTYLKEVWEIKNVSYLINNILILLYRTTLLETNKRLNEGKAQISSTLEEMSLLLALDNNRTLLYESTKHWMQDWQEEGFSEALALLQKDLDLKNK